MDKIKVGAIERIQNIWKGILPFLELHDFYKGAPVDILSKLNKVTFDIRSDVNFFELNGETSRVVFHPDFLVKIQDIEQDFLEHFLILFLVHEFYHPTQGINSFNYKGIGRTGFTVGMDEYADAMACYVATNFHVKRAAARNAGTQGAGAQQAETQGADTQQAEAQEGNKEANGENVGNENEEDNADTARKDGREFRDRRRGRYDDRDPKKTKEEKEKIKEDKRRRRTLDYHEAYYYCWNIIVRSVALFDEFPLFDPPLSRINRYLTTLLHRHLAKRITNFRMLKAITRDRWHMAFCGVSKKQNEEEDQVIDVEATRKIQGDLYFMYSVNGGAETKKILRDPQNLEPMWVIDCLLQGKFDDPKVLKALDYMMLNAIQNYKVTPYRGGQRF